MKKKFLLLNSFFFSFVIFTSIFKNEFQLHRNHKPLQSQHNNNNNNNVNSGFQSGKNSKDIINSAIKRQGKIDEERKNKVKVIVNNDTEDYNNGLSSLDYGYTITYNDFHNGSTNQVSQYVDGNKQFGKRASDGTNLNPYYLGQDDIGADSDKSSTNAYVSLSELFNIKIQINGSYQPNTKVTLDSKYKQLIEYQALSSANQPGSIYYSIVATGILSCPKICLVEHWIDKDTGKKQSATIGQYGVYNFFSVNGAWAISLMSTLGPLFIIGGINFIGAAFALSIRWSCIRIRDFVREATAVHGVVGLDRDNIHLQNIARTQTDPPPIPDNVRVRNQEDNRPHINDEEEEGEEEDVVDNREPDNQGGARAIAIVNPDINDLGKDAIRKQNERADFNIEDNSRDNYRKSSIFSADEETYNAFPVFEDKNWRDKLRYGDQYNPNHKKVKFAINPINTGAIDKYPTAFGDRLIFPIDSNGDWSMACYRTKLLDKNWANLSKRQKFFITRRFGWDYNLNDNYASSGEREWFLNNALTDQEIPWLPREINKFKEHGILDDTNDFVLSINNNLRKMKNDLMLINLNARRRNFEEIQRLYNHIRKMNEIAKMLKTKYGDVFRIVRIIEEKEFWDIMKILGIDIEEDDDVSVGSASPNNNFILKPILENDEEEQSDEENIDYSGAKLNQNSGKNLNRLEIEQQNRARFYAERRRIEEERQRMLEQRERRTKEIRKRQSGLHQEINRINARAEATKNTIDNDLASGRQMETDVRNSIEEIRTEIIALRDNLILAFERAEKTRKELSVEEETFRRRYQSEKNRQDLEKINDDNEKEALKSEQLTNELKNMRSFIKQEKGNDKYNEGVLNDKKFQIISKLQKINNENKDIIKPLENEIISENKRIHEIILENETMNEEFLKHDYSERSQFKTFNKASDRISDLERIDALREAEFKRYNNKLLDIQRRRYSLSKKCEQVIAVNNNFKTMLGPIKEEYEIEISAINNQHDLIKIEIERKYNKLFAELNENENIPLDKKLQSQSQEDQQENIDEYDDINIPLEHGQNLEQPQQEEIIEEDDDIDLNAILNNSSQDIINVELLDEPQASIEFKNKPPEQSLIPFISNPNQDFSMPVLSRGESSTIFFTGNNNPSVLLRFGDGSNQGIRAKILSISLLNNNDNPTIMLNLDPVFQSNLSINEINDIETEEIYHDTQTLDLPNFSFGDSNPTVLINFGDNSTMPTIVTQLSSASLPNNNFESPIIINLKQPVPNIGTELEVPELSNGVGNLSYAVLGWRYYYDEDTEQIVLKRISHHFICDNYKFDDPIYNKEPIVIGVCNMNNRYEDGTLINSGKWLWKHPVIIDNPVYYDMFDWESGQISTNPMLYGDRFKNAIDSNGFDTMEEYSIAMKNKNLNRMQRVRILLRKGWKYDMSDNHASSEELRWALNNEADYDLRLICDESVEAYNKKLNDAIEYNNNFIQEFIKAHPDITNCTISDFFQEPNLDNADFVNALFNNEEIMKLINSKCEFINNEKIIGISIFKVEGDRPTILLGVNNLDIESAPVSLDQQHIQEQSDVDMVFDPRNMKAGKNFKMIRPRHIRGQDFFIDDWQNQQLPDVIKEKFSLILNDKSGQVDPQLFYFGRRGVTRAIDSNGFETMDEYNAKLQELIANKKNNEEYIIELLSRDQNIKILLRRDFSSNMTNNYASTNELLYVKHYLHEILESIGDQYILDILKDRINFDLLSNIRELKYYRERYGGIVDIKTITDIYDQKIIESIVAKSTLINNICHILKWDLEGLEVINKDPWFATKLVSTDTKEDIKYISNAGYFGDIDWKTRVFNERLIDAHNDESGQVSPVITPFYFNEIRSEIPIDSNGFETMDEYIQALFDNVELSPKQTKSLICRMDFSFARKNDFLSVCEYLYIQRNLQRLNFDNIDIATYIMNHLDTDLESNRVSLSLVARYSHLSDKAMDIHIYVQFIDEFVHNINYKFDCNFPTIFKRGSTKIVSDVEINAEKAIEEIETKTKFGYIYRRYGCKVVNALEGTAAKGYDGDGKIANAMKEYRAKKVNEIIASIEELDEDSLNLKDEWQGFIFDNFPSWLKIRDAFYERIELANNIVESLNDYDKIMNSTSQEPLDLEEKAKFEVDFKEKKLKELEDINNEIKEIKNSKVKIDGCEYTFYEFFNELNFRIDTYIKRSDQIEDRIKNIETKTNQLLLILGSDYINYQDDISRIRTMCENNYYWLFHYRELFLRRLLTWNTRMNTFQYVEFTPEGAITTEINSLNVQNYIKFLKKYGESYIKMTKTEAGEICEIRSRKEAHEQLLRNMNYSMLKHEKIKIMFERGLAKKEDLNKSYIRLIDDYKKLAHIEKISNNDLLFLKDKMFNEEWEQKKLLNDSETWINNIIHGGNILKHRLQGSNEIIQQYESLQLLNEEMRNKIIETRENILDYEKDFVLYARQNYGLYFNNHGIINEDYIKHISKTDDESFSLTVVNEKINKLNHQFYIKECNSSLEHIFTLDDNIDKFLLKNNVKDKNFTKLKNGAEIQDKYVKKVMELNEEILCYHKINALLLESLGDSEKQLNIIYNEYCDEGHFDISLQRLNRGSEITKILVCENNIKRLNKLIDYFNNSKDENLDKIVNNNSGLTNITEPTQIFTEREMIIYELKEKLSILENHLTKLNANKDLIINQIDQKLEQIQNVRISILQNNENLWNIQKDYLSETGINILEKGRSMFKSFIQSLTEKSEKVSMDTQYVTNPAIINITELHYEISIKNMDDRINELETKLQKGEKIDEDELSDLRDDKINIQNNLNFYKMFLIDYKGDLEKVKIRYIDDFMNLFSIENLGIGEHLLCLDIDNYLKTEGLSFINYIEGAGIECSEHDLEVMENTLISIQYCECKNAFLDLLRKYFTKELYENCKSYLKDKDSMHCESILENILSTFDLIIDD